MLKSFSVFLFAAFVTGSCAFARVDRIQNPNILLLVSDEEGMIPHGWEETLMPFYDNQLPARKSLRANGIYFSKHYAGSTACVPSRGVIYTGLYPKLTGLSQTNGLAKFFHDDPSMTWLEKNTTPTIGNWLENAVFDSKVDDYRTPYELWQRVYIGKWHLSLVDLYDEYGRLIQTLTKNFDVVEENIDRYQQAKLLEPFGFTGWIGPEPHGAAPENSGVARDPLYVKQAQEAFAELRRRKELNENKPFFMAVNLVNPHDIVLAWAQFLNRKLKVDPEIPLPPVCEETDCLNLDDHPPVHAAYKETYLKMYFFKPLMNYFYTHYRDELRRFYYDLLKQSDLSIGEIMASLKEHGLDEETITIFTSDHGDLLGRRGGQWQKWHTADEEVVHVPLVVHNKRFDPREASMFTSHVDLVPTILGLLDIDEEKTAHVLKKQFTNVHKLPGKDLSPIIYDEEPEDFDRAIYTSTEDEISRGGTNLNATFVNLLPQWILRYIPFGTFEPVAGKRFVESARFYDQDNYFVLIRYFDPDDNSEDYVLYNSTNDPFNVKNIINEVPEADRARYIKSMDALREHHQQPIPLQQ